MRTGLSESLANADTWPVDRKGKDREKITLEEPTAHISNSFFPHSYPICEGSVFIISFFPLAFLL